MTSRGGRSSSAGWRSRGRSGRSRRWSRWNSLKNSSFQKALQGLFHGHGERRLDHEVELGHARDGSANGGFGGGLNGDHERQVAPVGVGQLEHGVDRNILSGERGGKLRDDSGAIV